MKRENQEDICLKDAFGATPDMCRQAVLDAVGTYREETKETRTIRKPWVSFALAAALLMLTVGSALALTRLLSVRDSVAGGEPSRAFNDSVVPLEDSRQIGGAVITLGDAVFDGKIMALALNVDAEEGAEVYLMPELKAYRDGEEIVIGYDASTNLYFSGMLYSPALAHPAPTGWGVNAEIGYGRIAEDVIWRLTLTALRPLWPVVDQSDMEEERRMDAEEAAERGRITVEELDNPAFFMYLPKPEGMEGAEEVSVPYRTAQLVQCGAFERLGEVTFEFVTPVRKPVTYKAGQTFTQKDYSVEITRLETTFLNVSGEMRLRFHGEWQGTPNIPSFSLFTQSGEQMYNTRQNGFMEEGSDTVVLQFEGRYISDEPLISVTFVPVDTTNFMEGGDFSDSFTVELTQ